jgi:hypothetical protein
MTREEVRAKIAMVAWVVVMYLEVRLARGASGHWPSLRGWVALALVSWVIAWVVGHDLSLLVVEKPADPPAPEPELELQSPTGQARRHEVVDGWWTAIMRTGERVKTRPAPRAETRRLDDPTLGRPS